MDIAPPVAYLMKRQDNGRRTISEALRDGVMKWVDRFFLEFNGQ